MSSDRVISTPEVNIDGEVMKIKHAELKTNLGTLKHTMTPASIGGGEVSIAPGADITDKIGKATFSIMTTEDNIDLFVKLKKKQLTKMLTVAWASENKSYVIHNALIVNNPDFDHAPDGSVEVETQGDPVVIMGN